MLHCESGSAMDELLFIILMKVTLWRYTPAHRLIMNLAASHLQP